MGFTGDVLAIDDQALLALYRSDDEADRAAALAEAERRDQAERLARARERLAQIRAEGELAAHAQYLEASDWCRGRLLSREGMAAGVDETSLWRMPWARAARFASEELRDFFQFVAPRITAADYVRVRAAESRAARSEAMTPAGTAPAVSVEHSDDEVVCDERGNDGPELAGDAAGSLRHEPAAEDAESGTWPGWAVRPGGRGPAGGAEGTPAGGGARRPAGPVQPARGVSAMRTPYVSYGEIEPLQTEYLLDGFPKIPRGDVTLFYGEGSVGKGRMICSLIADVVRGGGSVLTVLPEDHPAEEVAPRLRAAGVTDLSRVIDMTRLPAGGRFKLSADTKHEGDVGHLRQAMSELAEDGHDVRLIVIDPLAAVVGWGSISTNAGARRLIEPLQDLAMATGVAVIVVAHSVKSGVLQGSAGLQQVLRLVYKVTKDPANPALRVVHAEKANNLVAEDVRFTVEEDAEGRARVIWLTRQEMDRRNRSWRTPAPAAIPAPEFHSALMGIRRPGQAEPDVQVLGTYPGPDGARIALRRCQEHPAFRSSAAWQHGRTGLLSKYTRGDGAVVTFGVVAS